jgi:hypothetical protein
MTTTTPEALGYNDVLDAIEAALNVGRPDDATRRLVLVALPSPEVDGAYDIRTTPGALGVTRHTVTLNPDGTLQHHLDGRRCRL